MKKSSALAFMSFAMAMASTTETGLSVFNDEKPKAKLPPPKVLKQFKEQDGIINLIKDYNLIKSGNSKKGKRKQLRTIAKVEGFIEQGFLTKEDLIKQ